MIVKRGDKFNNWTIVKEVDSLSNRKFLCRNSDGIEKIVILQHLKSGASKGLSKKELFEIKKTHGMNGTRFYNVWQGMKRRCLKEYEPAYKYYGGRGITICEEWLKFEGFYKDMFDSYKENLTLDRIDNNGNYNKKNCRWATMKEQCNNARSNLIITLKGKEYKLTELSEKFGINYNTLYNRLFAYNIPAEKAIKQVSYRGKHKRIKRLSI